MTKPTPQCPRDDCKFINRSSYTTSAYYPPIYDKNGVNTNPDMNITTSALECLTCGKRWSGISQLGETVYIEVK